MIRGYRWKKRDGQEYLTRNSDGREVATVYLAHSWWWWVRGEYSDQQQCGNCDRRDDAKRRAEEIVKEQTGKK